MLAFMLIFPDHYASRTTTEYVDLWKWWDNHLTGMETVVDNSRYGEFSRIIHWSRWLGVQKDMVEDHSQLEGLYYSWQQEACISDLPKLAQGCLGYNLQHIRENFV
eukprot:c54743_g1_i1 orf=57-374(+)